MLPPTAKVTGWGLAVPSGVLTNETISTMVDTSADWIVSRTGIHRRRIAADSESTSSLATAAGLAALKRAGLSAADLDMVIVATSSPDSLVPATACRVQAALGAFGASAFDVNTACTGFLYALTIASRFIETGSTKSVLVIGAECLSRLLDWDDRNTCVLFGDGAGAIVLQATSGTAGVQHSILGADGRGGDLIQIPLGSGRRPSTQSVIDGSHWIKVCGNEVFRWASRIIVSAIRQLCLETGLALDEIDWIVPHQANDRILHCAAKDLAIPLDRFVRNLADYGNTAAASIPIALAEAAEGGRFLPGDRLVLVGFGGGLTWGAALLEWG
ncbi:MAG: ketoacyl-ACP synthase III [Ardenticatenia bacterium]|nr:ketoacyl-ACP synthase III [Ardenticatenia bacterium]